jgi:hypothetical protein
MEGIQCVTAGNHMAIVTFWKRKAGDKWVVIRREESPENATTSDSVEGEFDADNEPAADSLLQTLISENRITETNESRPPTQKEPEGS